MFIDSNTTRQELEAAAREAGLPVVEDTEALRASIVEWIAAGDECAECA